MKVADNFDLREFVDPETWQQLGEKSRWLIDDRIINCAAALRAITGKPVTINNWHTGGHYHESGLRSPLTTTGAKFSQHKFGRAVDCKVEGMTAEEVRQLIKQHWLHFKSVGLTTIEKDTPTWVHLDCRNTGLETLLEVPFK